MKKIFLTLMFGILCGFTAYAQCELYRFTERTKDYTPLTTATQYEVQAGAPLDFILLGDGNRVSFPQEDSAINASAIAIGFDFTFAGKTYDRFVISANGFIVLVEKSSSNIAISGVTAGNQTLPDNAIGLAGKAASEKASCEAIAGSRIRYATAGEDGQKQLSVEFEKIGYVCPVGQGNSWGKTDLTYTLTLFENGAITFHFGQMNFLQQNSYSFNMGLRADDFDKHFRKPNSDADANQKNNLDWTSTEKTTKVYPDNMGNSYTIIQIGRGANIFPNGTYWLFQQAEDCQAPENTAFNFQVEEIVVGRGGGYFSLNITTPERNFDGVVVGVSNIEPTDDFQPADGDEYESMDESPFGYVVYSNQEWTTCFPTSGLTLDIEEYYDPEEEDGDWLEAGETYYVSVYPYNYICEDGDILYGTPSVFSFTLPETVSEEALSVTACTNEAITLKLEDNDDAQEFAIVVTPFIDFEASHVYNEDHGYFGLTRADMKEGDTLYLPDGGFGGIVVYIGTPDEDIVYDNVQPNTIYYFGAFKKGQSGYSALYATAYGMTPAVFPFAEDFTQHPASEIAGEWITDFQRFQRNHNGLIYAETGSDPFITLPVMTLPNREVRLELNYLMFYVDNYQYRGIKRALWEEGDSIIVEISQNNNDFVPVYAIDRYNADDFMDGISYLTRTLSFRVPEAAPTRIRLRWKVRFGERYAVVRISEIRVVETPACDHPSFVYVADSTISDSRASVDWIPGISEETTWRISYAEMAADGNLQWSEPKEVTEHPYTLTQLANNTGYRVRVQAMCKLGEYSDWTYSNDFMTIYDIPMKEDFENLQTEIYKEVGHVTMLKTGWNLKQTELKETVELGKVYDDPLDRGLRLVEWRYGAIGYNDATLTNGAVMYQCGHKKRSWLEMPVLNFGNGNENYMLAFDIAIEDDKGNSVRPLHESTKLYIFYSTDNGKTYRAADSLEVFSAKQLEAFGDSAHVVVPLKALKNQCRLAFFFTSEATLDYYERIYIDNIEVYATCLIARDVRYTDLTDHSVSLSWRPIPQVENWIVKIESGNEIREIETTGTDYTFDNLNARTTYTVSVGHLCDNDTSDWQTVTFTTGGIPCDPVSGLSAERITTKSANLTWTGEAAAYNLQIRKANGTEWVTYTVNGTSRELTNLEADQTYEWRIQSVCGEASGDTSAYSEINNFKTATVTCFPPENLRVVSQNFYSALLAWTGTTDETFEISYKTAVETAYSKTVTAHGDSLRIEDLKAEEAYSFRIRRICSQTESSAWSEAVTAIIPAVPVCKQPTNLRSEAITDTSAQLYWDSENGNPCILRFRPSTASVWDSVKDLTEQHYLLMNLQPNTAYLWSVMSLCEYNLTSEWARQATFRTLGGESNEQTLQNSFRLYAVLGQLHILNDAQMVIEHVDILDRTGRLLQKHTIGHADNVIIPTTLKGEIVLVRIFVQGGKTATYKLHL